MNDIIYICIEWYLHHDYTNTVVVIPIHITKSVVTIVDV